MKFNFYFKNGSVLKSDENINAGLFNNPDLIMAEVLLNNLIIKIKLDNSRLIFYKKDGHYYIGKQKTINGINKKAIVRLGDGEVLLDGI